MISSINQKFQKNVNKCDICFQGYDRYYKQPMIICEMHHTICRSCLKNLQPNPKCPICRNIINFRSVVVNNYILQLLPNSPPPPNYRAQLNNFVPSVNQANDWISNSYRNSQNRQLYFNNSSIVDDDIPIDNNYLHNANNQNSLQQQSNSSNRQCLSTFCNRIFTSLQLQGERTALYIIIFVFQLPFAILDLYFATTGDDQACYDKPYRMSFYILRPWLLSMSIAAFATMAIMVFFTFLRICHILDRECHQSCEIAIFAIWAVKTIIWMIIEVELFTAVIGPHCSGGIYAYGLIQTIIYGIILVVLFGVFNT